MNFFIRHKALLAGATLILLTNIIVITGALGNRSGKPECVLILTERELPMNYQRQENSGLSLQLTVGGFYVHNRNWLDMAKMTELGFKPVDPEDRQTVQQYTQKALPKSVYVVLEYDGPAYRTALNKAADAVAKQAALLARDPENKTQQLMVKNAERHLEYQRYSASRLYAVDAGLEPGALRQHYADTSRYIITTGLVSPIYYGYHTGGEPYGGFISKIKVSHIHIPLAQRQVFDRLTARDLHDVNPRPRYQVELAYGRRLEPWIRNVSLLEK